MFVLCFFSINAGASNVLDDFNNMKRNKVQSTNCTYTIASYLFEWRLLELEKIIFIRFKQIMNTTCKGPY